MGQLGVDGQPSAGKEHHMHTVQTADMKRCRMVTISTILWTVGCTIRTVIIAMITGPCS